MKWPIPIDGNSSPSFHVVSPLKVPPDSFCQILRPIFCLAAADIPVLAGWPGEATVSTVDCDGGLLETGEQPIIPIDATRDVTVARVSAVG